LGVDIVAVELIKPAQPELTNQHELISEHFRATRKPVRSTCAILNVVASLLTVHWHRTSSHELGPLPVNALPLQR